MESDTNISSLVYLGDKINFYCPIIIIIIGTIGCLCNFITFTSRQLRKSSCSLYFLGAAIFDLITLDFGTVTRFLYDHFKYDVLMQSQVFCKLRMYIANVAPAIATCFIVLAALDRFMSTSSKLIYRSFATMKRAKWIATFSLVLCFLSYLHYMIFAQLRPTCSLQRGAYSVFTIVYSIVWTSFIPHFLMLSFGFGTQYHIRSTRQRVLPFNSHQRRLQRTETQFITMTLFQVGLSSLLILTRMSYYSYNVIASGTQRTAYQEALDRFFAQLTTQFFYLNYAKSFYVYTLCSKYFRTLFKERMKKIYRRLLPCRRNHVGRHQRNPNGRTIEGLQARHAQGNS
ncbi:unnamed protein product [Rotaria sp. Silwood1]|nr:unnamed protein product [Rotaria sp. Silwood1]CAF4661309.1 unnamed protein product [Rotaria sp. Silwood1]